MSSRSGVTLSCTPAEGRLRLELTLGVGGNDCNVLNWDDLRIFLCLAREGSISRTGRALGVNYTTVARRISAFEQSLGIRLFDRLSSGYVLTPTGEKLVGIARGIETSVFDIEETLSVGNPEISGVVRLAISDSMLLQLMPTLASFSDKHPSITLQCIGGNEFLDLERREADVAIRASLSEPIGLAAQYIAQVSASAYASRRYLKTHPAKLPVSEHIWVAWDDQSRSRETEKWYESSVPRGARIACRFDSGAAILSAVRAGMGVGFMWRFLGDEDPELVRLQLLDLQMSTGLWLLTTDSLERSPSIVAFLDHVAADVEAMRGRVPGFD